MKTENDPAHDLFLFVQGLSLVLIEGGLKDGEEREQPMEEDSADAELLPGYQWLLQDLPKLPLFDSVRGMTSTALQQVPVLFTATKFKTFIENMMPDCLKQLETKCTDERRKICP